MAKAERSRDGLARPWRSYLAIALVSCATLLLQIALTRILSVVLWYHWAFFSISIAMLGIGVPGVWLTFTRERTRLLPKLLYAAALTVPAGVVAIVKASKFFGGSAILFCLLCLLPAMLCLGGAVCILLLEAKGPAVGRMYAFDLLGACTGALLVIPLMWLVPTPVLAGAVGLLPLAAYLLRGGSARHAAAPAAVLVFLLVSGEPFALEHTKGYEETGRRRTPIYERWTPTARLTIFDNIFFTDARGGFGWGLGRKPSPGRPPMQYWLEQDGSAGTAITQFRGDTREVLYLLDDVTSVPYQLRPPKTVAVVGSGGGRDVLTALIVNPERIDAIELNAGIVDALRGPFGDFVGHIYDRPPVNLIVGEGRSVLSASPAKFDLIQISLIDSWAATAAGAYTLAENNLYTVEAFRLFWSRLSEPGLISISRWMYAAFGPELPRLLLLVRAALEAEGVPEPLGHVALLQGGAIGTLLIARSPFDPHDQARLEEIADQRGFVLHWPTPRSASDPWVRRVWDGGAELFRRDGLYLDPPTDDRPFFFQTLSPLRPIRAAVGTNAAAVYTLQWLMAVMALLTLVLFFLPFALHRWLVRGPGFWRGSAFFASIGVAFMFVEIAWLQRFVLYLGHPSVATTVSLGSLLLGAGLGSMTSGRLGVARGARLSFVTSLAILAVNALLGPLFAGTLGCSSWVRLIVAGLVLIPTGFTMGFFFPLGMVRFGEERRAWFWAQNGAAGVLASVASLALSMELGFSAVANLGAAIYLVAGLLLRGRVAASGGPSARG